MIGRVPERQELEASLSVSEAQLIAVCGLDAPYRCTAE